MNEQVPPVPAPENPPAPEPPSPTPAPPPAAKAVLEGKTERELQLERELEEAQRGRRTAEQLAAEKEDEAKNLRDAIKPTPAPKKRKPFFQTFFDDAEED